MSEREGPQARAAGRSEAWQALRQQVMAQHQRGQLAEAEAGCLALLSEVPDDAGIVHLLGIIAAQAGRLDRAIPLLERAVTLNGSDALVHFNLGRMQWQEGRFADCEASFGRAAALRPGDAEALYWRGNALRMLQRPAEALASFDAAMARRPLHPETLCGRAGALQELGRSEDALRAYAALTARFPDYPQANYQKGLCLLQMGRWPGAWRLTEWRRQLRTLPLGARSLPMPMWTGAERLQGRTLLVHFEQGLGDTIQMSRFVRLVEAAGASVILLVQPPLKTLLQDLSPGVRVIVEADLPVAADYHCPLFSLPAAFDTRLETLPADIPYLRAEPARVERWRQWLGTDERRTVGVCWQGSSGIQDIGRSLPLAALAALARPGLRLVSLQRQVPAAQLAEAAALGIDLPPEPFDAGFLDTAALVTALDLVISCDTSIAHLAGALGRPAWVALKHAADWRWMLGRSDSPWYPTLRLFRQPGRGDWEAVFRQMAEALGGAR